jgi:hypothetical protein
MFTTGSKYLKNANSDRDFKLGAKLTDTCMRFYEESGHGLGGETVYVSKDKLSPADSRYLLRPEVIESVFYLWRYTKDQKYRTFGETMITKLETHCRNTVGYHTISGAGFPGDKMESFFLAETLKYLYLLFSDDNVMSCKTILIYSGQICFQYRSAPNFETRFWFTERSKEVGKN